MKSIDYYEFLQISPRADQETIHRVYRFLAARFHPDNPESGNSEMFSKLTAAYEVLSHPKQRAEYDANWIKEAHEEPPLSNSIDFMDTMAGEMNRRLAVLAVLYFRRRTSPSTPEVSLAEIETRMGFPRDYLDFTTWYLQKKGYITKADNSDFTLTATGVDFVETQRVNIPILNKLLTSGMESSATASATVVGRVNPFPTPVVAIPEVMPQMERRIHSTDRRANPENRRANTTDRRKNNADRRANPVERRVNTKDRRSKDQLKAE